MTRWQTKLPWNDRKGQFSPLKALTLALVILPGALIAWRLQTGQLGAKPITEALHQTGLWAIRLLLITLAVTPFRLITGYNRIVLIRRMLGVAALAYGMVHLGLYIFEQKFDLWRVGVEIVLRFYLTIGFVALVAMTALGVTSTDGMIRRMGALAWNRLHLLVWPLTLLALWHGALQSKIDAGEHIMMTGLLFALAGVRLMRGRVPINAFTLLALALLSMALAAGVEYAWYALATGLPADRVFAANFMLALQPRPALLVGLIALALPFLAAGAGFWRRRTA
jgi:sulfoxide reductase heme-binding subunit YedZ